MKKIEIIVVDDYEVLQFLHKTIISMAGMGDEVPTFSNGKDALNYLYNKPEINDPILVLLDINMPVMDGWEFLEALPKMEGNEHIYVSIVTSSVDDADRKKSLNYPHVFEFLEKPIKEQSLKMLEKTLLSKLNGETTYFLTIQ